MNICTYRETGCGSCENQRNCPYDNMTNQQKFIEIFGIDAWQQMIVFMGVAKQFKEYWTSPYKEVEK